MVWTANLLLDGVRYLLFIIDMVIYWLAGLLYDLFIAVSGVQIFSETSITEVSDRIMAVLGVFMIFKVAFSIIQMIADPNRFADKEKGLGKIIISVMLVLFMLIFTPTIFKYAYQFQKVILEDNVIGNVILGNSGTIDHNKTRKELTTQMYSNFFYIEEDMVGNQYGGTGTICTGINENSFNSKYSINEEDRIKIKNACAKAENGNISTYLSVLNVYAKNADGGKEKIYVFNYTPLIPSLTGGIVAFLLFTFTIDIAVRAVKLGVLQIMAPIPIISYIDPVSAKNGAFKKWTTECIKTYVSLFVRLAIIYFVFLLMPIIEENLSFGVQVSDLTTAFAKIFIILGLLIFAGQAPKYIMDMFGIKNEGSLNPIKKIGQSALAGGVVGGVAGGIGGLASNIARGGQKVAGLYKDGHKGAAFGQAFKTIGSSIGGLGSGTIRGLNKGSKSKEQFLKAGRDAVQASNKAREARMERKSDYIEEMDNKALDDLRNAYALQAKEIGYSEEKAKDYADDTMQYLEEHPDKLNSEMNKYNIDRKGFIAKTINPGARNIKSNVSQSVSDFAGLKTDSSTKGYSKQLSKLQTEKARLENAFSSLDATVLLDKDSKGNYNNETAKNLSKAIDDIDKRIKRTEKHIAQEQSKGK